MALRSLATRMRVAAASALRRRQPSPSTPPAEAPSRFVIPIGTTRSQAEQHANGSTNNAAARPLKSMDDQSLQDEGMRKINETLREGNEELRKQWVKIKRVAKLIACTAGVTLFLWIVPAPAPPSADTKNS